MNSSDIPTIDVLERSEAKLSLESCPLIPTGLRAASDVAERTLERAARRRAAGGGILGISTGLASFDGLTDGLEPGDFMLVGSRPSMGKTALCLQIASHVACVERKSVAVFSFAESAELLALRMIGSSHQISSSDFRDGLESLDVWDKFRAGLVDLKTSPIYFDAPCQKSFDEVIQYCHELRGSMPELALIIVDDIQRMILQGDDWTTDGAQISRALKDLAIETGSCVIAASQLSRQLECRLDKRPQLRDWRRDSGKLDLHADIVCGLYRQEYYDEQTRNRARAELILLKNAKACTGTLELSYKSSYGRFEELN